MFFSGFAEWVSAFFLDLLLVLVHALSLFQRLIAGGSYLGVPGAPQCLKMPCMDLRCRVLGGHEVKTLNHELALTKLSWSPCRIPIPP